MLTFKYCGATSGFQGGRLAGATVAEVQANGKLNLKVKVGVNLIKMSFH